MGKHMIFQYIPIIPSFLIVKSYEKNRHFGLFPIGWGRIRCYKLVEKTPSKYSYLMLFAYHTLWLVIWCYLYQLSWRTGASSCSITSWISARHDWIVQVFCVLSSWMPCIRRDLHQSYCWREVSGMSTYNMVIQYIYILLYYIIILYNIYIYIL